MKQQDLYEELLEAHGGYSPKHIKALLKKGGPYGPLVKAYKKGQDASFWWAEEKRKFTVPYNPQTPEWAAFKQGFMDYRGLNPYPWENK